MESEGSRFKIARKKLALTLQDVVSMTGYSMSTLSGVENGHDTPSKRLRQLLIDRFDINEDWLKTGNGEIFKYTAEISWAKIATEPERQMSPVAKQIYDDAEFVSVINKLRIMTKTERRQHLNAFWWLLDELVKYDKSAASEPQKAKVDRSFAALLFSIANDKLQKAGLKITGHSEKFSTAKNELTDVTPSSNTADVKSEIRKLIGRVKSKASKQPGAKAELARKLGVAPARISEWLSGTKEPGGEYTLRLLKWVEQS